MLRKTREVNLQQLIKTFACNVDENVNKSSWTDACNFVFFSLYYSIIAQRLIFISGNKPTSNKKALLQQVYKLNKFYHQQKVNIWQDFWILGLFPLASSLI